MSDLAQKVETGWGYKVGPFPPDVVLEDALSVNEIGSITVEKRIAHWPTATPPTMAEIESVKLPPAARAIAPYDFQLRFTDAELAAIQTSIDPVIIRGRTMLQTIRDDIELGHPATQQLIGYMVSVGILTPNRSTEILS